MDELLKTLVIGAPNLMVAIVVLYLQEKRIKALLDQMREDWKVLLEAFIEAKYDKVVNDERSEP